jgi:hypothetical protein
MIDASRVVGSGIESNPSICGISIMILKENIGSNLVFGSFRELVHGCPCSVFWYKLFPDEIEGVYLAED